MATIKKKTSSTALTTHIVIAVCILILIVIPFTVWFLSHKNTPLPTPSAPKDNFTSLQQGTYSLSYPQGWQESESGVPEGIGSVVYLQPPNANPIINPHVVVKVVPTTQKAISTTNLVYTLLNYQKTDTTVDGVAAQKYTAVLQSVHGPLHSIAYVFQKSGNIYLVELGYTQKNTDLQLEGEFSQIVNKFLIK